jgi:YVTN family beta-propeller protein
MHRIWLSHDQKRLYVANTGSNDVTIIDTATDRVSRRCPPESGRCFLASRRMENRFTSRAARIGS